MKIPTYNDVKNAAKRIEGFAVRTPLLNSTVLDELTGARVFVKAENLQRTGSFKFRGAYNAIASMQNSDREKGVIAASSGNHAQGVAAAAGLFGVSATILMPSDAPKIKIARTKALGAKVIHYDRSKEDREAILNQLVEETGLKLVHPFNDEKVIAGQGTTGLEIAQELEKYEISPDRALVCTGGGGLTSGVALALKKHFPDIKVHTVEPEGFDDYKRSLETGYLVQNAKTTGSVCDAIITPMPGNIGFEINKQLIHNGLVVSDQQALSAVKFAFQEMKIVVEPGGAVALAAVLKYAKEWQNQTIVLTISGGNIDLEILQASLSSA